MSEHVRTVFRSALGIATALPYFETIGQAQDPATLPTYWTTLDFPIAQAERVSLGYPYCARELGTVWVHVLAKSGSGDAQVIAYAEAVRVFFEQPYVDDVRMLAAHPPSLVPADDGPWLDAVVAVDYAYDYVVAAPAPFIATLPPTERNPHEVTP